MSVTFQNSNHQENAFEFSKEKAKYFFDMKCQKHGFKFHSKQGFLLLKQFFLYLFPTGLNFMSSRTKIKRLNMQEFADIFRRAELNFPDYFTNENFEKFQENQAKKGK
jgi:hypothetical protein